MGKSSSVGSRERAQRAWRLKADVASRNANRSGAKRLVASRNAASVVRRHASKRSFDFDNAQILRARGSQSKLTALRELMSQVIERLAERHGATLGIEASLIAVRVENRFAVTSVEGVLTIARGAGRQTEGGYTSQHDFLMEVMYEPEKAPGARGKARARPRRRAGLSCIGCDDKQETKPCSAKRASSVRNPGARLYARLRMYVRSAAIDASRARQRRRTIEPGRIGNRADADAATGLAKQEMAEKVREAIASLPPFEREVIQCRLVHGISIEQIAHDHETGVDRTRRTFTQARMKLQTALREYEPAKRRGKSLSRSRAAAAVNEKPAQSAGVEASP